MAGHDIIVVGASAGGVEALTEFVGTLPGNLPAAVFIVLHIPAQSPSQLPKILNRFAFLEAIHPEDGMKIEYGYIYVAMPDHHMLIEQGKVRIVHGPKENRHRPAIDPLFRSAAKVYGPRVVGVVLTGSRDDGTAGLLAIKRCGGIAVVQDPNEALYPSMPTSALENVEIDYTLPLADIGPLLERLAREEVQGEGGSPVAEDMEMEIRQDEADTTIMNSEAHVGMPSPFSCPGCGGVLWEIQDGELLRFRCRVGHGFSIESMMDEQAVVLESALWVAMKTLQESAELSHRMAQQARQRGQDWVARRFEARFGENQQRIALIQRALLKGETIVDEVEKSK
jgi:two-component system, chemotaxis family, protein-glutamate methylesterase/glutaminase